MYLHYLRKGRNRVSENSGLFLLQLIYTHAHIRALPFPQNSNILSPLEFFRPPSSKIISFQKFALLVLCCITTFVIVQKFSQLFSYRRL